MAYTKLTETWDRKRRELGLTQADLAQSLGMSQSSVSDYLNGKMPLGLEAALKFAEALEVASGSRGRSEICRSTRGGSWVDIRGGDSSPGLVMGGTSRQSFAGRAGRPDGAHPQGKSDRELRPSWSPNHIFHTPRRDP